MVAQTVSSSKHALRLDKMSSFQPRSAKFVNKYDYSETVRKSLELLPHNIYNLYISHFMYEALGRAPCPAGHHVQLNSPHTVNSSNTATKVRTHGSN